MNRRHCLALASALVLGCAAWPVASQPANPPLGVPPAVPAAPLRSLAVLDFELVDEQNNPLTKAAQLLRLAQATRQIQRELTERGLYRVLDPAPSAGLQAKLRDQQEFLYRCDDCAEQVGLLLGADLVMATWVQKVSELILNLNVQIYDVKAQKVLLSKSVDMRGNEDLSWTRAVHYLVRDMAEKRERNPRYGQ